MRGYGVCRVGWRAEILSRPEKECIAGREVDWYRLSDLCLVKCTRLDLSSNLLCFLVGIGQSRIPGLSFQCQILSACTIIVMNRYIDNLHVDYLVAWYSETPDRASKYITTQFASFQHLFKYATGLGSWYKISEQKPVS